MKTMKFVNVLLAFALVAFSSAISLPENNTPARDWWVAQQAPLVRATAPVREQRKPEKMMMAEQLSVDALAVMLTNSITNATRIQTLLSATKTSIDKASLTKFKANIVSVKQRLLDAITAIEDSVSTEELETAVDTVYSQIASFAAGVSRMNSTGITAKFARIHAALDELSAQLEATAIGQAVGDSEFTFAQQRKGFHPNRLA